MEIPSRRQTISFKESPTPTIATTTIQSIYVTHEFNISITDFVRDIMDSVNRPNGYLDSLEKTPHLQDRFEMAIAQIYST
ncbi:MAG TPA: hypothetical protein VEL11_07060 [Candidatus Bathyarchaeia archaeon]|nr:hypothetical protein [Candidatus Bathyarchaeia archaeon]